MPLTEQQIRSDMAFLSGQMSKSLTKWRRAFNRYANNGRRTEDLREQYGNPLSYYNVDDGEDTGITPSLNLLKAVTDTHVSKITQVKVRPFFNPLVGTFKTRKVCRNTQIFFDEYFEEEAVHDKAIQCARFADIFERGVMWVNDVDHRIDRLPPWEYYFDASEFNYGDKLSRCFVFQIKYPLIWMKEALDKNSDDSLSSLKSDLKEKPFLKVNRVVYYDLLGKKRYLMANDKIVETVDTEFDESPCAVLFFEPPVKGSNSISLIDIDYPVQSQVDSLCRKIHLALELSPANSIWIPKGSDVKASILTNEIGAVYAYQPIPTVSSPITISTPPAFDPQYERMLEFWIRQAFEMPGISQLSAQAKKPSGLNSGVALQTVEDVESDRHNPFLQSYIKFYMDIARKVIAVFPKNDSVLPKKMGRANITWKDIKKERDTFSIQFSATSSLSKDPKVKMEQIEKLLAMKIIDQPMVASLLELPDLEGAFGIMNASYDWAHRVIERAVEDGNFTFYEVGDLKMLFSETASMLLRLDANDEEPPVLEALVKLLGVIKGKMDAINTAMQPPQESPMKPPVTQGPTGPLPMQGQPQNIPDAGAVPPGQPPAVPGQ
jgi:hypothetical protein